MRLALATPLQQQRTRSATSTSEVRCPLPMRSMFPPRVLCVLSSLIPPICRSRAAKDVLNRSAGAVKSASGRRGDNQQEQQAARASRFDQRHLGHALHPTKHLARKFTCAARFAPACACVTVQRALTTAMPRRYNPALNGYKVRVLTRKEADKMMKVFKS